MRPLTFTALLTILFFSINAFANHDASVLRLQTFNHAPIIVEVNGIEQNHTPVSMFELKNMAPGKHRIKIFTIERTGRRAFKQQIFSGRIHIAPASIITGVMRFGDMDIHTQPLFVAKNCCTQAVCSHHGHNNYGNGHNKWDNNDRYNQYDRYDRRNNNYGYDQYDRYNDYGNYGNNYNSYNRGMNSDDFNQLKRMMDRQSFEDSKLKIAKQATRDNYLNSNQVRQLLDMFTFESTKLEFAKFAYDNVTDKNRYYTIYDAFTYSSSIDEMENYVRK